tara:strand:+ start:1958 stop:2521 length:564 start_codon:yes stop_codon:yes gene_type:complete
MKIKRIMESTVAGKDTHKHKSLRQAFRFAREAFQNDPDHTVLDLFARTCPWGDFRNDLNPQFKKQGHTNMCMDALEAARTFENNSIDIILFDPPFSSRMDADKYEEVGAASLWTNPKYISELGAEMNRILTTNGLIIKCGFNSNKPYSELKLERLYISHYGACRNDMLVSVWKKMETSLFNYYSVND